MSKLDNFIKVILKKFIKKHKNKTIELNPISPLFKNIFSEEEYEKMKELKITQDDLMMDYFGINMNIKGRLIY